MSIIPESRPNVPHPPWCDPRACWAHRSRNYVEVFHRLVALGDPSRAGGPCVEIVSFVHYDPTGSVVPRESEPARVFLRGLDDEPMTAEQAGGIALALALAAAVLRGAR